MKISAVVLTKNEEKNIKPCLESLCFCDEIIIIDDFSFDKTRKIALSMKQKTEIKIFKRALNNDFSAQRNFGLRKAKGEWVLFVDADERVSPALRTEISSFQFSIFDGVYLRRKDFFLGRWLEHGETGRLKLLRLAKKRAGFWQRKVHEVWRVKGIKGELKNPLLHFPHPTIHQFLEQINQYTTINANQLHEEGQRFRFWQFFTYPLFKFIENYFLKLGFLDCFPGIVIAFMMSFHSLITRIKLWEKQK